MSRCKRNSAICNYTGCVSESGDFATLFFFWFSNTGADAAITSLLPTLKRFSCNRAADWSTTCFCCESVLQKPWEFCDRSAWISKRFWDSSQSCCSISPCHQDLGSKLRGYWFYTKEERWLCKNSTYTRDYCGCERRHWKKSTPFCESLLCVTRAVWSQRSTDFTLPSLFFNP